MKLKFIIAGLMASGSLVAAPVMAKPVARAAADPLAWLTVDVPAKKFVLKNGLTLIALNFRIHSPGTIAVALTDG